MTIVPERRAGAACPPARTRATGSIGLGEDVAIELRLAALLDRAEKIQALPSIAGCTSSKRRQSNAEACGARSHQRTGGHDVRQPLDRNTIDDGDG